jgi:DNA modification methylase
VKTTHKIIFDNSADMSKISDESINLMVTSPPYPMIEMWDEIFSTQNPAIREALRNEDGNQAFELMHKELDKVWREVHRVLKNGGFACINIGNATRKIGEEFKLYSNHSRILEYCITLGFSSLPEILWRKQTNAPNKFMGSGMLPAGAYVTLEHEHILVLRKGNRRIFQTDSEKLKRQKSAYFWEERNLWFSDIWEDLKGTKQKIVDKQLRERSGAYPFELAYRLINMLSLKEDTVLDPFLGTGTTMVAAMTTGRNSIGFEIDDNFANHLSMRFQGITEFANDVVERRLKSHLDFVKERINTRSVLGYKNRVYGFPVMTRQEVEIEFSELSKIIEKNNEFEIEYKDTSSWKFNESKILQKTLERQQKKNRKRTNSRSCYIGHQKTKSSARSQ